MPQLDLVKLAEGERATLQHEINGYRAEAEEQAKARAALGPRCALIRPWHWFQSVFSAEPSLRAIQRTTNLCRLRYANKAKHYKTLQCAAQAIQQLEQERDKYASNAARANAAHAAAIADAEAKAVGHRVWIMHIRCDNGLPAPRENLH